MLGVTTYPCDGCGLLHGVFGQIVLAYRPGEVTADGGLDALENFFFVLKNRITQEIQKDPEPFRPLWNGLDDGWKF